jgi:hypothetical protein
MRRWKERYLEVGYDGLFDRRTRKPSPKRVPVPTVKEVLRLYQENYADFNVRHFQGEAARATPHSLDLHLGEARLTDGRVGEQESETRSA